ncbi:hypothetical protein AWB70_05722 [Caballeronia cordobensis]|uniref:Uncharacterized protein n=1 Tax=Caballeronia cordobensis TaxID=1353886 RepID=A0A158J2P3_CABCO|nr:hypothetical protein [Caballeronia cordobensis]SAL62571.1 hypothetical protein AWB70_05722 [Caballeronia cordobensis]
MAFPKWGRSFNALYVPLSGGFGWQCTLMTRREFHQIDWFMWRTHPYGDLPYEERGNKEKEQQRQIAQDRRDFDRLFRPRIDRRSAYLSTEFRRYVDFIRHELRVSSWDVPVDGDGITRVLRRAVQDGRLVPAINRKRYWWSGQEVYKWYAPQYWPKAAGGVSFNAKSDEVLDLREFAALKRANVDSGFGSDMLRSDLGSARDFASGAGDANGSCGGSGSDWLGAVEAVAVAALGGASFDHDSDSESTLKSFGDADDSDGGSPLSDAQPFEYQPDTLSTDVVDVAGSQGTPGNNQAQNKQTNDIARILRLTPGQARQLHDEISGEGLGYHEIMERAKDMFDLW